MTNNDYGFIITRHVNSEKTNKYWNKCVRCIREFYPFRKIVIIDDNSNQKFVKSEADYKNLQIITSEFPGRGELLPYYYFLKYKFFENAVIIHDSVFFHKRISFELFNAKNIQVLPFWHFNRDKENVENSLRITNYLKNSIPIQKSLTLNDVVLGMPDLKWYGIFGVQTYINYYFLKYIDDKYSICNMLKPVTCRLDRCCLERIMGCIFFTESKKLRKMKSLIGNIFNYKNAWIYTYDRYEDDVSKKNIKTPIVKVWSGR